VQVALLCEEGASRISGFASDESIATFAGTSNKINTRSLVRYKNKITYHGVFKYLLGSGITRHAFGFRRRFMFRDSIKSGFIDSERRRSTT
jgi:hypothetical protein